MIFSVTELGLGKDGMGILLSFINIYYLYSILFQCPNITFKKILFFLKNTASGKDDIPIYISYN